MNTTTDSTNPTLHVFHKLNPKFILNPCTGKLDILDCTEIILGRNTEPADMEFDYLDTKSFDQIKNNLGMF